MNITYSAFLEEFTMPILLYLTVIFIWGSTWILVKFQLSVPVAHSLFYRFGMAAVLIMAYLLFTKKLHWYSRSVQLRCLLMGQLLFCWNYVLVYHATSLGLTTGLVAMIFSLLMVFNTINNRIFYKEKSSKATQIGGVMGLIGMFLLFKDSIPNLSSNHDLLIGIGLCVLATYLVSLGNMLSKSLQREQVKVMTANAWSLFYAGVTLFCYALLTEQPFVFDTQPSFILSLLSLIILGTIVGFWCYLTLLGQVGADKAAYVNIVFPVWALILSSLFEGYSWSVVSLIGVGMILAGNITFLRKKQALKDATIKPIG